MSHRSFWFISSLKPNYDTSHFIYINIEMILNSYNLVLNQHAGISFVFACACEQLCEKLTSISELVSFTKLPETALLTIPL